MNRLEWVIKSEQSLAHYHISGQKKIFFFSVSLNIHENNNSIEKQFHILILM